MFQLDIIEVNVSIRYIQYVCVLQEVENSPEYNQFLPQIGGGRLVRLFTGKNILNLDLQYSSS